MNRPARCQPNINLFWTKDMRHKYFFILFLILVISGCANPSERISSDQELEAEVIYNSINGGALGQSPGADWITDEKGLLSSLDKINRQKIGTDSTPIPAIYYEHEGVLLIRMGRKPTGGYAIELASKSVNVRDGTATVSVRWIEPPEDAILVQIITSPCMMIKLPRDNYSRIRVVDQNGIVRAKVMVEIP